VIAVRFERSDRTVEVVRLHPSVTQRAAQYAIDAALDYRTRCQLWTAQDTLLNFDPHDCVVVQVLVLQH
jgi:hypothetical protein